jgi:hypothetical protein
VRTGIDRFKRVLRPVLALLAVAFVVWALRDLVTRWESGSVRIVWGLALASLLPLLLGGLVLAAAWKYLLERMAGSKVELGPSMALHAESQLARYIPGKVGIPVVRMAGAKGIGVSAAVAGSSVFIELLSFVAVGGVVGFALIALLHGNETRITAALGRFAPAIVLALGLSVVLLVVVDRRRYPARLVRALDLEGRGPLVPRRLPLLHVVYWLTWAAHGYLVTRAVGAEATGAWSVAGVFIVAPIVGFLALAAPAGAGVREAVLSVGLVPAVGAAPALSALMISRAATLVVDLLVWLMLRPLRARPSSAGP